MRGAATLGAIIAARDIFMRSIIIAGLLAALPVSASAFCGFYVAKADGELFNEASKVVYVRDGNKSTITMSSDFQGPVNEFAMIVPTPKVLKQSDVRTVNPATVDHLDAYTAPRLVEYHDYDPCEPMVVFSASPIIIEESSNAEQERYRGAAALGVTIEAEYSVGIYDILMLSAEQSDGLITWLKSEEYNIPDGAEGVLQDYIKMGMKFFVAKVNLQRHSVAEKAELEPLQMSFRSRDFMLPIQLGKVNGNGFQDALFYMITRTGRVDPANYPALRIPADVNVPVTVEQQFPNFYKAMFANSLDHNGAGIVTEYAWDMAWCDPCAADPLSGDELRELGAAWIKGNDPNAAQDAFVTRLHARYSADTMPNDIMFTQTKDRTNFQGRYVMNHPFTGKITCEEGEHYVKEVRARLRREAVTLHDLTGWPIRQIEADIRKAHPAKFW